eukprot:51241-Eustigmatos_ZCMA.PRE.2
MDLMFEALKRLGSGTSAAGVPEVMAAAEGQWRPTVDGSAFPHEHIVQGGSDRFKCAICLQKLSLHVFLYTDEVAQLQRMAKD